MNRRIALIISLIAFNLMACCCSGVGQQAKPNAVSGLPIPPSTPSEFIDRFGPPDSDESSENEVPRPLVLSRRLVYKAEDVLVFCIPEESHKGNRIPVSGWQIFNMQTITTKAILSDQQVLIALAKRDTLAKPPQGK